MSLRFVFLPFSPSLSPSLFLYFRNVSRKASFISLTEVRIFNSPVGAAVFVPTRSTTSEEAR